MTTNSTEKEILFDVLNNPNDTFYESVLSDFLDEQNIDHDFRKPLHNNKITEIKPYQEKCLDIWANYWTNIGLCTNPTDEKKAERYFYNFYKELGFSIPEKIIWFNNPIEMCSQIKDWENSCCLINQIWNQLNGQVLNRAGNRVFDQVGKLVSNQVWYQVWRRVGNQVWDQLWNQVSNQLLNQVFHGQQDAHLFALYSYMMQVLRIETYKSSISHMLLAQEVNWWIPTEKTIYATRKPKECIFEKGKFVKITFQDNYTIT
jgi:hypothetical protein